MVFIMVFGGICFLLLFFAKAKNSLSKPSAKSEGIAYVLYAIFMVIFILVLIGGAS